MLFIMEGRMGEWNNENRPRDILSFLMFPPVTKNYCSPEIDNLSHLNSSTANKKSTTVLNRLHFSPLSTSLSDHLACKPAYTTQPIPYPTSFNPEPLCLQTEIGPN
jgi:hypothetical protein